MALWKARRNEKFLSMDIQIFLSSSESPSEAAIWKNM